MQCNNILVWDHFSYIVLYQKTFFKVQLSRVLHIKFSNILKAIT